MLPAPTTAYDNLNRAIELGAKIKAIRDKIGPELNTLRALEQQLQEILEGKEPRSTPDERQQTIMPNGREFPTGASVRDKVLLVLKDTKGATPTDYITKAINGESADTVMTNLSRMRAAGLIKKLKRGWWEIIDDT